MNEKISKIIGYLRLGISYIPVIREIIEIIIGAIAGIKTVSADYDRRKFLRDVFESEVENGKDH
ncbi:hypothetical protein [Sigmofec virus UA08Rod_6997]|uniref:Uncharacterized protein n=1 Tax=Sigmofec virus UA08Rod_6997 TaxID=2929243 RepID=A0A976R553_9VIRU|nr:hypothetical protein [Sigmofec virus UA08Rod_6997]